MTAVTFDSSAFIVRYPEFASVDSARLQSFFDEATLYLSNSDDSPVSNVTRRAVLLNMLTAHVAVLSGVFEADGRPLPAGRISQASQGNVSATFEMATPTPGTGPWFQQTQYGSSFWQATSNLRGFRYIPNPTRWR